MSVEARSETSVPEKIDLEIVKKKADALISYYRELNLKYPEGSRLNSIEMKLIRSSLYNALSIGEQPKDFYTLYNEIKSNRHTTNETFGVKRLHLIPGDNQNLIFDWMSTSGSIYNINPNINQDEFINMFPKKDLKSIKKRKQLKVFTQK